MQHSTAWDFDISTYCLCEVPRIDIHVLFVVFYCIHVIDLLSQPKDVVPAEGLTACDVYDPCFLLPLFSHVLTPGTSRHHSWARLFC